jgi:putative flippase GtrA
LSSQTDSRAFDSRTESRRIALFLVLGGLAAAANWLSRFPLELFMPFWVAVGFAYLVGMAIAFALFSRYVFPASSRPLADQIKMFVLVNIAGIAQVWAVSVGLVYWALPAIGFTDPLAQSLALAVAIGVPAITSYFAHKFLTFRPS